MINMFYFLGRGSDFYDEEGNTSAFFIENNKMVLIDCGETVFGKILENELLNGINDINVMITHLHPDHVGSLASLIFYCYYRKQILPNIIVDENIKYMSHLKILLGILGVNPGMYKIKNTKDLCERFDNFEFINFIQTKHQSGMNCYGIEFLTKDGMIYYSGDSNNLDYINKIISSGEVINTIYTEATFIEDYVGSPHTSLRMLDKDIPEDLRKKVFCMHFDDENVIEKAIELRFNVVDTYVKK